MRQEDLEFVLDEYWLKLTLSDNDLSTPHTTLYRNPASSFGSDMQTDLQIRSHHYAFG